MYIANELEKHGADLFGSCFEKLLCAPRQEHLRSKYKCRGAYNVKLFSDVAIDKSFNFPMIGTL